MRTAITGAAWKFIFIFSTLEPDWVTVGLFMFSLTVAVAEDTVSLIKKV